MRPRFSAGQVNTGQTVGSVEPLAASATKTNRVWLDWLTLGAAVVLTAALGLWTLPSGETGAGRASGPMRGGCPGGGCG